MGYIENHPLQHASIMRIYSDRPEIISNPEYQRNGEIWTLEKKQLLIDSILNNYDIPKIYFHQFSREERLSKGKSFAIIDGKQRLEAIWSFMDGIFPLADEFEYQLDPSLKLSGLTYEDLGKEFSKVKTNFDSFTLPIISVITDDLDLIEDMFSRLNEAVPLNSAEKRNAFGGEMIEMIRKISRHSFFDKKVKFANNRYQHQEAAARLLLVELSLKENKKIIDTKKVYLDAMVKNHKKGSTLEITEFGKTVSSTLDVMSKCFALKDTLLRAQGSIVVFYLLFKVANENKIVIKRSLLLEFIENVRKNREKAELDYAAADYDLLEYDRLNQHGTNDVANIKERLRIISERMNIPYN